MVHLLGAMRPAGAATNPAVHPNYRAMLNRINNAICLLIAAAAFAAIGIEAGAHHQSTHSGTQEYVRY